MFSFYARIYPVLMQRFTPDQIGAVLQFLEMGTFLNQELAVAIKEHHDPSAVSAEARLLFAKRIAAYLVFLAENTGLASRERCAGAAKLLASYTTLDAMLHDISR